MQVEIITIGDEILIGQIVDTNSPWMAAELNKAGFEVVQITSVHDDAKQITEALELALERAEVVLFTGGIGPTKDDITKQTLCRYFGAELVFDARVYADIELLLKNRMRAINELTKSQAMVPDKAVIIPNPVGTAPITWFDNGGKVVVSMPGVPYEMKRAMKYEIIPRLQQRFQSQSIIHKTLLVAGYPESALALKIADWENALPEEIHLAYLPHFNIVKLRLSAAQDDYVSTKNEIDRQVALLESILGDAIIATEDISLEELVGRYLLVTGKTLATAESCTGGHIAHRITTIAGSSAYFKGSVVAYNNEVKSSILGVDEDILNQYGAVSEEVVKQMAIGVAGKLSADFVIATSGIAGPDGGTNEKPVGTVWIAVGTKESVVCRRFQFSLDRQLNIERTTQTALLMLLESEVSNHYPLTPP
ncbi:MAG: competence/damage-inducible protein A [Paludibacter sp.]|nr:competence/damage-inducible protein A [Paludibacter sp.]MDD4198165.1 competence/damage-inducible protein A [Paludibacter sp.]MDD4426869.1 competence/damage-inducible protein A [Paludibacter sp.]